MRTTQNVRQRLHDMFACCFRIPKARPQACEEPRRALKVEPEGELGVDGDGDEEGEGDDDAGGEAAEDVGDGELVELGGVVAALVGVTGLQSASAPMPISSRPSAHEVVAPACEDGVPAFVADAVGVV